MNSRSPNPLDLADELEALATELGLRIWVAGRSHGGLLAEDLKPLRVCDLVFCIWGLESKGEESAGLATELRLSQLEVEVLKALLYGKEVYFFVRRGFRHEPLLMQLIEAFEGSRNPMSSRANPLVDSEILTHARKAMKARARRWHRPFRPGRRTADELILGLARARAPEFNQQARSIRFLSSAPAVSQIDPDTEFIRRGLDHAQATADNEERLFHLWPAVREAHLGAPLLDPRSIDYWPLWNELLGQWTRTASWLGLHGHFLLSPLAALNSMAEIRDHLRRSAKYGASHELTPPYGPLATAYYSIAQRLPSRSARRKTYGEALLYADLALEHDTSKPENVLPIRGSTLLRLGRPSEAISDYKEAWSLRDQNQRGKKALAEMEAEIGFASLFQGKIRSGLKALEHADKEFGDTNSEFHCRVLRKLAIAYAMSGSLIKAWETKNRSREMARELGAFDQMRRF